MVALLRARDFEERLPDWLRLPARRAVNALLPLLCSSEELPRWRAVRAIGFVVSRLADADTEAARAVLRRLMWSLTDESGGIGWGAPEAMGEIMAAHGTLADEFSHVLVSYLHEDGILENDLLLRGVVWALGRLAQARPHLLVDCAPHLEPFLASGDAALRGLASWALTQIGSPLPPARARALLGDEAELSFYLNGALTTLRVCDLAALRPGRP